MPLETVYGEMTARHTLEVIHENARSRGRRRNTAFSIVISPFRLLRA
jgi:hypothetical protein